MAKIQWNDNQKRAIITRGQDLLVSAGAGSGKTAVLTERVLTLLKQGVSPESFLIVTYTQAAAALLRSRIAAALAQQEDPAVAAIAQQLGRAQISTVHGFCMSLLREYFVQAGIDPNFRVMDEAKSKRLRDRALGEALEEAILTGGESVCDLFAAFGTPEQAAQIALGIYETSRARPDSALWRAQMFAQYEKDAQNPKSSRWAQILISRAQRSFARAAVLTQQAAENCFAENLAHKLLQSAALMHERATCTDYDAISAPFDFVRMVFPRGTQPEDKLPVTEPYDQAKALIGEAISLPQGDALLLDEKMVPALGAVLDLCTGFEAHYTALKQDAGGLDFSDLEHLALKVLKQEEVQTAVRARFAHIFIDEYQDANALQEAILSLAARGDNRFMVGDVKQSIYGFRMAEPSLFVRKYHAFAGGEGGMRIDLNENYRAGRKPLAFANEIFSQVMCESLGGVDYDEAAQLKPGRDFDGFDTQVCVLETGASPEADGADAEFLEDLTAAGAEAELIAQKIRQVLGMQIPDGAGARRVTYGDISILLRAPRSWQSTLTDALLAHGIPAAGEADNAYYDLCEVRTFLNLPFAIDNRRRDISLIGAMCAPYGGFSPSELVHVRSVMKDKTLSFFDACLAYAQQAEDALAPKIRAFLDRLLAWREQARYKTPGDFLRDLLEETGYLTYCGTLPLGNIRAENLRALCLRADEYETLSDFLAVAALGDQHSGERGAPPLPENPDAVHILSIHRAKGLEFPIVFVSGLGKRFNRKDTSGAVLLSRQHGFALRYCDREEMITMPTLSRQAVTRAMQHDSLSEEVRVLYVALTRPVYQLILTGTVREFDKAAKRAGILRGQTHYEEAGCFFDLILPALVTHPQADALRTAAGMRAMPTRFESALKFERWSSAQLPAARPAAPDAQAPSDTPDPGWVERRLSWRYCAPEGALPRKLAVTQLQRVLAEEDIPVPDFARDGAEALHPAARGTALHALFAAIDPGMLTPDTVEEQIDSVFARLCQKGAIPPACQRTLSPKMAAGFYQSDLGRAAMVAKKVYREAPFNLIVPAQELDPADEGRLMLQGVIDLYFENDLGGLTVVDFKTGRLSDQSAAEKYGAQLGAYCAALERITQKHAQGYLYLADMGRIVRLV